MLAQQDFIIATDIEAGRHPGQFTPSHRDQETVFRMPDTLTVLIEKVDSQHFAHGVRVLLCPQIVEHQLGQATGTGLPGVDPITVEQPDLGLVRIYVDLRVDGLLEVLLDLPASELHQRWNIAAQCIDGIEYLCFETAIVGSLGKRRGLVEAGATIFHQGFLTSHQWPGQ
ncbi:hypothetical protein SRABI112_04313 [Pseudomonas mediterranea]|nr:hypothetical protein SRABI112_04313 [Pseudomonas mediterranea]